MENPTYTLTDIEAANAPNTDPAKSYVRRLGSFEHLLWLLDQASPRHFSLAAQIEGPTTVGDWRAALDHVQRRHPFFSVCIEKDRDSNPQFRQVPDKPIPLRVVRVGSTQPHWLTELLQREVATPFDPGLAPLVRAVLMHEPHRATLIFSAHHSIADGLSLTFAIRDMLLALSGNPRDPLLVTPSIESMLDSLHSSPIDLASTSEGSEIEETRPSVFRSRPGLMPSVRGLSLSAELTVKLRKRAQQEETTVHGALCAALVLAGRQAIGEWEDKPVRVLSPIDMRKLLGIGEHCGLFISAGSVSFKPNGETAFWELARFAKSQLAGAQSGDGVTSAIHAIQEAVSKGLGVEAAMQLAAHGFAYEAMVSNLGNLRYETGFGEFNLKAMWGPAIGGSFEGGRTIGVVTLNDTLHLLHTSYAPVPFLLEGIEKVLLAACEGRA
jgi:Condensation domain